MGVRDDWKSLCDAVWHLFPKIDAWAGQHFRRCPDDVVANFALNSVLKCLETGSVHEERVKQRIVLDVSIWHKRNYRFVQLEDIAA